MKLIKFLFKNNTLYRKFVRNERVNGCLCGDGAICRFHMNEIKANATLGALVFLGAIYIPMFLGKYELAMLAPYSLMLFAVIGMCWLTVKIIMEL